MDVINDNKFSQTGAFNLRENGTSICHGDSEHIKICLLYTSSQEADTIDGFTFVWFTDGIGWKSARGNLRETFEVMDTIYSSDDMENGIMDKVFR